MTELVNKMSEHKFLERQESNIERKIKRYEDVELGYLDVGIGIGIGIGEDKLEVRKEDKKVLEAVKGFYKGVRDDIKEEIINLEKEIEGLVNSQ